MKGLKVLIILSIFEMSAIFGAHLVLAASVSITANVESNCGNNIRELFEQCDGIDLGGESCETLGYARGSLSCKINCTFDVSACVSGGGGGGGGGGGTLISETKVIFTGRAYPKSTVTLLKDAQIVATTISGADANFQMSLTNISAGSYIFSVYSEDDNGNRSTLLTFPLSVTSGVTTNVTGIFISPTIDVDKSEVKKGEVIKIFGQSIPNSDVTVIINSEEEIYGKTKADKIGAYLYNLDTLEIEMGDHLAKSRATLEEEISPLSKVVGFKVGTRTILKELTTKIFKGDFNNDKKVNLIDFSIAAYWYKRLSPPQNVDLNKDGKVDLIDFSIMAYYWTG